jgi:hypothetical protein
MRLERNTDGFLIDASLLSELLNVPAPRVQVLMRQREITSRCERGEGEHKGQYRLTVFHKGRRARLIANESGDVVQRSVVDFGDRRPPSSP